jgi:nicotinate dehydrogenase subunit A
MLVSLKVNGKAAQLDVAPNTLLVTAIRENLRLTGTHVGCDTAQCGACTVLLDGEPVRSCVRSVDSVGSKKVVTLNGIGTPEKPHKVQAAFIEEQVPQCGYCLNGWVMTSVALLDKNPKPSDGQIREALAGLKCRCGTHTAVLRAVKRAAQA